ncbi:hydroxypyruvate isomerase [Sinorhizobium fredii]
MADVPGRCEPGTGEVNWNGIAKALNAMGYSGPIGMEAWAAGDPEAALEAFRTAFTV